jgi:hypothetical protein
MKQLRFTLIFWRHSVRIWVEHPSVIPDKCLYSNFAYAMIAFFHIIVYYHTNIQHLNVSVTDGVAIGCWTRPAGRIQFKQI